MVVKLKAFKLSTVVMQSKGSNTGGLAIIDCFKVGKIIDTKKSLYVKVRVSMKRKIL